MAFSEFGGPLLISATVKVSDFKFRTQFGFGEQHAKKTFIEKKTEIDGVLVTGAFPKFWDPLIIFAAAEASDFKFGIQQRFDEYSMPKTTFMTLARCGLGEHAKNFGTPTYFCSC